MNWERIAEIALTCIASVGGMGAIIIWVIKSVSDSIADKLSKKYQLQLDKEKETFKAELSKKGYVSKAKFDTELSIYKELTAAFFTAVRDINGLVPAGLTHVSADENARKEQEQQRFEEATRSVGAAQQLLHANACFIPKEFCAQYQELLQLCALQLDAYVERFNIYNHDREKDQFKTEDYKRTVEINEKWKKLLDDIRDYLSALDVV